MASLKPPCSKIRINLSPAELAHLVNKLRLEFGPFVVSTERAQELRGILAMADKDIKEHNSEIARLQEQISVVQAEKQRLVMQRTKIHSLLSPMRRLSNEILFHIFQYVCEENLCQINPWLLKWGPNTRLTSPIIAYLPSMAVSSVCSRWRTLALSSPSLWANLEVETQHAELHQMEAQAGFIGTVARYLERSGDWPLRLTLNISGRRQSLKAEFPSLSYLTQHAHRWKAFKYRGDYSLANYRILSGLRFPLLAELDIYPYERDQVFFDMDCFEHAPRLCVLSTPEMPTSKAPYHQLRHLSLQYSHSEVMELLPKCPSIKSLALESLARNDSPRGVHHTWRNITSLAIVKEYRAASLEKLFSSFDLPSLNVIAFNKVSVNWPTKTFISFISRSSCIITTFTLRRVESLSDLDLIATLRVMPSLLHLEIEDSKRHCSLITLNLISSLTEHESASIALVPKLHSLHLVSQDKTFDDSAFISMVESRWFIPGSDRSATMLMMGRGCIQSVVLKFDRREVDAEVYKPLRILDKEGLRVVVAGTNGIQV